MKRLCKCGCGQEVKKGFNYRTRKPIEYIYGHNRRKKPKASKKAVVYCACGCGEIIKWKDYYSWYGYPNFIEGHQNRGRVYSKEVSKQRSENLKGKFIGKENWNYGRKISKETRKKMSLVRGGNGIPYDNSEYSAEFNNELKEQIRKRDNYECQICGITEEEHLIIIGEKLGIHHIDYNKDNNKKENLTSLCRQCHSRTNFNRDYWEKLLTEEENIDTIKKLKSKLKGKLQTREERVNALKTIDSK
jgi:hypothetical protein